MEIERKYSITEYATRCLEHGNKAEFLLIINYRGVMIPLCQECIDDLYDELGKYATK